MILYNIQEIKFIESSLTRRGQNFDLGRKLYSRTCCGGQWPQRKWSSSPCTISIDFGVGGASQARAPQYLRNAHVFISYWHHLPTNILVCSSGVQRVLDAPGQRGSWMPKNKVFPINWSLKNFWWPCLVISSNFTFYNSPPKNSDDIF